MLLAIEGKVDFLKKTNPWGSPKEDEEAKALAEAEPDPEGAARRLMQIVERRQRQTNRQGKKRK